MKKATYLAFCLLAAAGYMTMGGDSGPTKMDSRLRNPPMVSSGSSQGIESRLAYAGASVPGNSVHREDSAAETALSEQGDGVMIFNSRPELGYFFKRLTLNYEFTEDKRIDYKEARKLTGLAVAMARRWASENDYNALYLNRKSIEVSKDRHKIDIDVVLYKMVTARA